MILEVQRYCEKRGCGNGLPFIVGADLTTWWDSDTTVFGEMMRIGLPLVGPHAATFYSRPNGQTPADATLQLGYVFAPGRSPTASPSKRSTTPTTGAPATTAGSRSTSTRRNTPEQPGASR